MVRDNLLHGGVLQDNLLQGERYGIIFSRGAVQNNSLLGEEEYEIVHFLEAKQYSLLFGECKLTF